MSSCDYQEGCKNNPNITNRSYCISNYQQCARFKIRTGIGEEFLPYNLKPEESVRAREILNHGYMHHEDRRDTYY